MASFDIKFFVDRDPFIVENQGDNGRYKNLKSAENSLDAEILGHEISLNDKVRELRVTLEKTEQLYRYVRHCRESGKYSASVIDEKSFDETGG